MDLTAAAAAMQSLKAAIDVTKAVIDLNTGQAVNAKVGELQRHMLEAQQAIFAGGEERATLAKRVRDLEDEIARASDWKAEKERYELKALAPGVTAYALKPAMQGVEPPHHLCPNCYQDGTKSILQGEERQSYGGAERKACPRCDLTIQYTRRDLPKRPPPRMPR